MRYSIAVLELKGFSFKIFKN